MNKPYFQNDLVTLYNGDCLEVMPRLEEKFDACITDPPYGTTACKWDAVIPFDRMWSALLPVVKEDGAIVFTASQPFTSTLVCSNLADFKYSYVWVKTKATGFQNAKIQPMRRHEDVLVFYRSQPTFNQLNLVELDVPVQSGRKRERNEEQHRLGVAGKEHFTTFTGWQDSVLSFANPSGAGHLHPTQKPVDLMKWLVKTYTNEGDIVLDFTAGSGSTGVACMETNRRCVLIENDAHYCDVIADRLSSHHSQLELF